MTALDDKRIRFYLENQELIDTWAGLASDTRSAFSDWLIDLRSPIDDVVDRLGGVTRVRDVDRWKIHMAARPTWNSTFDDDARFIIAVEWNTSDVGVPSKLPYVGLRICGGDAEARELRTRFLDRFGDRLRAFGAYQFGNPRTWWPAWRYVAPEDERWWEHTDEYQDLLLESIERAWNDFAPIVDEWLTVSKVSAE